MISNKLKNKIYDFTWKNIDKPEGRNKHFTFITQRSKIICYGYNQSFKTHPLGAKYNARFNAIHSELDAIKNFPYMINSLYQYDMINIRVRGDHTFGLSKPCYSCHKLLIFFGVREVYYSTNEGFKCLQIKN